MKRFKSIILLSIILIIISSVSVFAQTIITNKEAVEDIKYLMNKLEEVHPNIYHTLSKEEANNKIINIKNEIDKKEKWSNLELYRLISPFVASFKDGHTRLEIWYEFNEYYNNGGKIIPVDIKIIDNNVMIDKNYSTKDIAKGEIILSINDINIEDIISNIKKRISSENNSFAYSNIERMFPIYLWAIYDLKDQYILEIENRAGDIKELQLDGIDKESRNKRIENNNKRFNWKLDFPLNNTAFLTINTFNGSLKDEFKEDIKNSFKEIKQKDIDYLFIDISENGGGNTDLAKILFEYFYDKPYSVFNKVEVKYSDYALKQRDYNFFTRINYSLKKDKNNIVKFDSDIVKPSNNEYRFDGKVFIITSSYTFSTAADFAAMVKDFNAGTIIGEETGGLASSYGDVISDQLPNSKLHIGISYKYFLRPAGFDNGRGVIPDKKIDISKLKLWYDREQYQKMIVKSIIF